MFLQAARYAPLHMGEDGTHWPSTGFHGTDPAERANKRVTLPPVASGGHAQAVLHESLHSYLIHRKVTEVQQESGVLLLQ